MKKNIISTIFILFSFILFYGFKYSTSFDKDPSHFRRIKIFDDFDFIRPCRIKKDKSEKFYILDRKKSQLYVFNKSLELIHTISKLGRTQKDLYAPADFAFDSDEKIYIIDSNNFRIQIFKNNGRYMETIPIDSSTATIAINSKNEIILNQPRKKNLLFFYNNKGDFLRKEGDLMSLSHAYPNKKDEEKYKIPLSRISLDIDQEDNIYVAYFFAPIIQKYNSKGELQWEHRIKDEKVDYLTEMFWKEPRSVTSASMDGIQMSIICSDIAVDINKDLIYVLIGNGDLYVVDTEGKRKYPIREERGEYRYASDKITITEGKLFSTSFEGVFKLEFLNKQPLK